MAHSHDNSDPSFRSTGTDSIVTSPQDLERIVLNGQFDTARGPDLSLAREIADGETVEKGVDKPLTFDAPTYIPPPPVSNPDSSVTLPTSAPAKQTERDIEKGILSDPSSLEKHEFDDAKGDQEPKEYGRGVEDLKVTWKSFIPFSKPTPPPHPPRTMDDAPRSPEFQAGIISRHFFTWPQPMMFLGSQRPLQDTDLWVLDKDFADSKILSDKLMAAWERRVREADAYNTMLANGELKPSVFRRVCWMITKASEEEWRTKSGRKRPSLMYACNEVIFKWYWTGGAYKLLGDCNQILTPLLIKYIINFIKQSSTARANGQAPPNVGRGVGAAIGLSGMILLASLCNHQFFYRSTGTGVLLRGALISCIYEKGLKLTGKERVDGLGHGKLINHISTDVSRIDFAAGFFHLIIVSPIQACICLILLCLNLGWAAVLGFVFFVVITPLQTKAMKVLFSQRLKAMIWTDQRSKLLSELLNGMKLIKFFAWELPYLDRLNHIRTQELGYIKNLLLVRSANTALAVCLPVLSSVISFLIYGATHGGLNIGDVFASLALFQLLRLPLSMLPMALSSATDAVHAFGRLETLFLAKTLSDDQIIEPNSEYAINVSGASFEWDAAAPLEEGTKKNKKSKIGKRKTQGGVSGAGVGPAGSETKEGGEEDNGRDKEKPFGLNNVEMRIKRGQLVAVVGAVGSGKSSLLQALIGEMRKTAGTITFSGSIGYCPQTAWIQNATIRENILFGQPWDEERYWAAVRAASLEADLEILSGGDATAIGEKGINLSGGQKQRVSIARMIYFDADIVLLDDPLSAVDAHVGKSLFYNAIDGALQGKTRILVTHQLHFLAFVDHIICINNGQFAEQGPYEKLIAQEGSFSRLMKDFGNVEEPDEQKIEDVVEDVEETKPHIPEPVSAPEDRSRFTKQGDKLITTEERYTGAVGGRVYKNYFKAGRGVILVPMLLITMCLSQVATVMTSYVLIWWQEGKYGFPIGIYMTLYGTLAVASAVFTFLMGAVFAFVTFYASVSLHRQALARVMKAPQSFFDTTPLGRIQNRFGKDMDNVDNQLPEGFRMVIITLSQIMGSIILIAVVQPYFLIACVPVFYCLFLGAAFYRRTARELKRLDSILRSSIYSHFGESLNGLSTIRAYGEIPRFIRENHVMIDYENRAYYMTILSQRWLGVRIDALGNLLVLVCSILSITLHDISAAEAGLALGYVISIVQAFSWLVRQVAEVENDSTSVERILHYADELQIEAPHDIPETTPPASWPQEGKISFRQVHMSYRPGLPEVLKGFTMEVKGGEKIGVVGRTGAGKSTIMQALFRLVEISKGRIEVDGVDISKLGLSNLRKGLSIIPQEPLLFSGTIRSNLDPFGIYPDDRLWDAMKRAYLTETDSGNTSSQKFTLETVVEDEGLNLSVGERSLVSLARALTKDAKVVVLDEATASVDMETDSKIQETIAKEFKDKTILCIAHRLRTILNYDRICVMDQGSIVEFDTPVNLYLNPDGIFRSMCEKSSISLEEIRSAYQASASRKLLYTSSQMASAGSQPVPQTKDSPNEPLPVSNTSSSEKGNMVSNPSDTMGSQRTDGKSSGSPDLKEEGFKAADILTALGDGLSKMSEQEKKTTIKKTNGIFQLNIKNAGKEAIWTIDLKKDGDVVKGPKGKPDVIIFMDDAVFTSLADGTLNAQKAFMSGKLKIKGNIMLSTKLDSVLKSAKAKL
ncbi:abc transporter [Phaffia rhodozyma]|uniref:Abc transporter n=1 Tax=Phaffia rhodozyma TaxID=264483 RepID=A0A0F7SHN7_PHARH|nr:abc transporter [Phaffia rhodozyma]